MKKFMRENLKFICLALIILAGSFAIGTNVKKAGAATRKCYTTIAKYQSVFKHRINQRIWMDISTDPSNSYYGNRKIFKVSYPAGNNKDRIYFNRCDTYGNR